MNKNLRLFLNSLLGRTKTAKSINYSILILLLLYSVLIAYPNMLFGKPYTFQNFKVYSTQPLDGAMRKVLEESSRKLAASELNNKSLQHTVFLCNDYKLYTLLAPFARTSFACNYPFVHNIFIANANVQKNEAYKNDASDRYTRSLSALIAHEVTHTLMEHKMGFWKSRSMEDWKAEGYCDFIGNSGAGTPTEQKAFLQRSKNDERNGTRYKKYGIAVDYLMREKKMRFEEMRLSDLSLAQVLQEVEQSR